MATSKGLHATARALFEKTKREQWQTEQSEITELRAQLAAIKDILENGANGEKLAAIERVIYGGESK